MNINNKIIAKELQGEKVLLNMENGDYFTLNSMGAEIYDHISDGKDIPAIIDILLNKYDISHDILKADIISLINQMKEKNIIIK